jgi:hypothetical protein
MLSCAEVYALFQQHDVADLPEAERRAVQTHLALCGPCDLFVESVHAVAPMVRQALELEVSDALQTELDAAVMDAIKKVG